MNRLVEIFITALKLGLTSFGGPAAHLGYFRKEYVETKQWLSDKAYQDIVALCQFLPGPASSQVGMAIGMIRGGVVGGVMAFIGFTLPSVVLLMAAAYFLPAYSLSSGWIKGLKLVAVVVILDALIGMSKTSLKESKAVILALISFLLSITISTVWTQLLIIVLAGIVGSRCFSADQSEVLEDIPVSKRSGIIALIILLVLMVVLMVMTMLTNSSLWQMTAMLFRSGLFVFGGGHVVLPLLEQNFVPTYISDQIFIAGYGLAQAVPGPLFTFAAYIGTVMNGFIGGWIATVAIFLPAFLLVAGCMPFWKDISSRMWMRKSLLGINAAVIGILAAAWFNPVIMHTIKDRQDVMIAVLMFLLFRYFKMAPWKLVVSGILIGLLCYR